MAIGFNRFILFILYVLRVMILESKCSFLIYVYRCTLYGNTRLEDRRPNVCILGNVLHSSYSLSVLQIYILSEHVKQWLLIDRH